MSTPHVRWALVGTSEFAVDWVGPALRRSTKAQLSAIVSRDAGKARAVADRLGAGDAVTSIAELDPTRIDAVHLIVPNELHEPLAIEALARGFHVLVEKPIAPTIAAATAMINAANAADRVLAVGHCMAWAPPVVAIEERLARGDIGQPVLAEISAGFDSPPAGLWRQDRATRDGGGPLMDLGSHAVDVLLRLFGPVARVSCELSNVRYRYAAEDTASVLIRFVSGAHAILQTTFSCGRNDLTVQGSTGRLTSREWLGRDFAGDLSWQVNDRGVGSFGDDDEMPPYERVALERTNVYVPQVDDVSDAIRRGTPPRSDGRQGLAVLQVLDAALRSAEERRTIEVTPARRDPGGTRS